MSNLISGEEALEKYNESQVRCSSKEDWVDLKVSVFTITDILRGKYFQGGWRDLVFRLKPQTIKINGIEVPKPFKPKEGDVYWVLNTNTINGYARHSEHIPCLAWRTEEEVKQVVELLRSVLNG